MNATYFATVDVNGVLCVDMIDAPDAVDMGLIASRHPETIYFEVAPPANRVAFYASQDVPQDRSEPLSTWSVYREEYAPNDLDNPLDDLTVMVVTVKNERLAHAVADYLYEMENAR